MTKETRVMIIFKETNEAIYIGTLGEVPQWLMAGFNPIDRGYDFATGLNLILVERRKNV